MAEKIYTQHTIALLTTSCQMCLTHITMQMLWIIVGQEQSIQMPMGQKVKPLLKVFSKTKFK